LIHAQTILVHVLGNVIDGKEGESRKEWKLYTPHTRRLLLSPEREILAHTTCSYRNLLFSNYIARPAGSGEAHTLAYPRSLLGMLPIGLTLEEKREVMAGFLV
jgi:hypothetical protein